VADQAILQRCCTGEMRGGNCDLTGTVGIITGGSENQDVEPLPKVIGAASGIGHSAVTRFAAAGAAVIYALDLNVMDEEEISRHVMSQGYHIKVVAMCVDITSSDSIEQVVRTLLKDHGRLDWFVGHQIVKPDWIDNSLRTLVSWTLKTSPLPLTSIW